MFFSQFGVEYCVPGVAVSSVAGDKTLYRVVDFTIEPAAYQASNIASF